MKFHRLDDKEAYGKELIIAIIGAVYKGKWIFVRHGKRDTWEIPAGHREKGEDIDSAAARELFEETGALEFEITPVCLYSMKEDGIRSFGKIFYAQVESIGKLPDFEIDEIALFDELPENLTYPVQRLIFERLVEARKSI